MIKNVIVDCDPGHDDIMAIMSILAHREAFNLLGLTTVSGNNLVDRVTDNLLKVLTYLDVDLKVAKGYDKPLVYDADPQIAHGESGLDGPVLPASKFSVVDMHAIEFMKQMAQTHDKITIIALAPLTNVALFLKTYPELKEKIECITLMGGSRSSGNILKRSEFNIYADPHAADIVFKSNIPVIMSDIEICLECSTDHEMIDGLKGKGYVHELAYAILEFFSQYNRKRNKDSSPVFDLVPVMQMLHPELFTYKKCQVDIELEGVHTRGMTVVSEGENCLLVEHLNDRTLYNQYFMEDLSILEERYSSSR